MPLTILGHWNMQNMSRNYTVVQGKNTDDRVKKKTYLCGQTGHRGCYVIKKLAFLDLKCKMLSKLVNKFFFYSGTFLLASVRSIYLQSDLK